MRRKHKPCKKCGTLLEATRHHILPVIFYGKGGEICHLCNTHHIDVEKIISDEETMRSGRRNMRFKLTTYEYRKILADFLSG